MVAPFGVVAGSEPGGEAPNLIAEYAKADAAPFSSAQRLGQATETLPVPGPAPAPGDPSAPAGPLDPSGPSGPGDPPAPGDPSECTVSEILVPSCGAWLGAATTDEAVKYDYATGLKEYEAVAQNAPDIQHFYSANGKPIPTRSQRALAHRPGHDRSLLLINWKPSKSHTWAEIADGEADHLIASAASGMKTYEHTFFLAIWHEPENDFGYGREPADYVDMYRHVVDELESLGVSNVVYVWTMMGYSGHSHLYDDLYPGDDYVDWIAWDPYANKGASMPELVNEDCCRAPNWDGFYDWAVEKSPGTPLMLAEWGFNLKQNQAGPAALRAGASDMREMPALKAFVYWNQNGIGTYRLDTDTSLGREYGAAYRQFANDPYFNSTSTADAP